MVDKTLRMNLLFDFYGQLLTERQRRFFEMYYADDLSLGEIAEHFGVSRQAVYDIIKRSAHSLEGFESLLGLVERYMRNKSRIEELDQLAERLVAGVDEMAGLPDSSKEWLRETGQRVREIAQSMIDDGE